MAEYIERGEAIELLLQPITMSMCLSVEECHHKRAQRQIDRYLIEGIPAADVRPVVRGHWIGTKEAEEMGDIMKEFTCSVCGCCEWDCTESESFNFCPNCGADMREES